MPYVLRNIRTMLLLIVLQMSWDHRQLHAPKASTSAPWRNPPAGEWPHAHRDGGNHHDGRLVAQDPYLTAERTNVSTTAVLEGIVLVVVSVGALAAGVVDTCSPAAAAAALLPTCLAVAITVAARAPQDDLGMSPRGP